VGKSQMLDSETLSGKQGLALIYLI
jgi:hypothetical protein